MDFLKDLALIVSTLLNIGAVGWHFKSRPEKRKDETDADSKDFEYYVRRIDYLEKRMSAIERRFDSVLRSISLEGQEVQQRIMGRVPVDLWRAEE